MPRTSTSRVLAAAALAALCAAAWSPLRAQDDPARDARLLYYEGKFREADELLAKAPPDVQNDVGVRTQLAEAAQKFLKGKDGEDRRAGLEAVKRSFGVIANGHPDNGPAVAGAVLAAKELADLDIARKQMDGARAQATWALQLGEKAAAAGLSPETKAALGAAYGLRASVTRKVDLVDQVSADYTKGAEMLEQAAQGHERESEWLEAAAELRFDEATFIHDSIPIPAETRDDTALTAAVGLARRACEAKGANDAMHLFHIKTLCAAHEWKLPGDLGAPFMEPLKPPFEGLSLQVPKGGGWKRLAKTDEWDLILERNYDPSDSSVQLMLSAHGKNEGIFGKTWSQVDWAVSSTYDKRKGQYTDVVSDTAPTLLGDKKKGPQLWHFQLAGTVANSDRRNRMAAWIWPGAGKSDVVYELRVIDWRHTTSVEDPDIVAFVQSAIPAGLWPPGAAAPPDPKGKKPPKKK